MKHLTLPARIGTIKGLKIDNGLVAKAIFSPGDINTILSVIAEAYPSLKNDIKTIKTKLINLNFQIHTDIHVFRNEVDFEYILKNYNEELEN